MSSLARKYKLESDTFRKLVEDKNVTMLLKRKTMKAITYFEVDKIERIEDTFIIVANVYAFVTSSPSFKVADY
jgi:hypothetical protein